MLPRLHLCDWKKQYKIMILSVVCVMCSRLLCPYLSSVLVILSSFLSSCVCLIIYDYTVYFIVLSVQFDLVWSTQLLPGVPVCVYLASPCPAQPCLDSLKTVYLSYILVCVLLDSPSCVHRDRYCQILLQIKFMVFYLNILNISVIYSCDAKLNFQHHFSPFIIVNGENGCAA